MAVTTANPDDEVTSALWNELAGLVNGTSGFGNPVSFVQLNSASFYGLTVGNLDTTNGLIMKLQYGPISGPTTLATFDKTRIESFASLRLSGGAVLDIGQASTPAAPGASLTRFYTKTDGLLYFRAGAAGAETGLLSNPMTLQGDIIYGGASGAPTALALPTKGYTYLAGASGPIGDPWARKNRLVNATMRISQRATMPTTDDNYCLDRWNLLLAAANAATVAQETSDVPTNGSNRALKLTVGSGNNNKFGIMQPIEFLDCSDLRGKVVSLQFKMKSTAGIADVRAAVIEWTSTADTITSDVVSAWNTAGTNPTLAANWAYCTGYTPVSLAPTTSWATYKIEGTMTVGASTNNLAVFIWSDDTTTTQTTDVLRITDVQLEEGTICTQVDRPLFATQLLECQRWFWETAAAETMGNAAADLTNPTAPIYQYPVVMRASPTITALTNGGGTGWSASTGNNGTFATVNASAKTVFMYNSAGNWTSGANLTVKFNASAEL